MRWLVGVDEAGRGPVAGELVVAAFAQRLGEESPDPKSYRDSKRLSEVQRENVYQNCILPLAKRCDAAFQTSMVSVSAIDNLGIEVAWSLGVLEAVGLLAVLLGNPSLVVVDGSRLPKEVHPSVITSILDLYSRGWTVLDSVGRAVVDADDSIWYVSAASIVAKVTRDRHVRDVWHNRYPEYGFNKHKGYGTKRHIEAIRAYGLVPGLHRRSFVPRELRGCAVWRAAGEEGDSCVRHEGSEKQTG